MSKTPTKRCSQAGEAATLPSAHTHAEKRTKSKRRRRRECGKNSVSINTTANSVFRFVSIWTILWMNTHLQKTDCFVFRPYFPERFRAEQKDLQKSSRVSLQPSVTSRTSRRHLPIKMSQTVPQHEGWQQGQILSQQHRRQRHLQQQYYQQHHVHMQGEISQVKETAQTIGSKIKASSPLVSSQSSSIYKSLANYYRRNKVDIIDKIDTKNITSTVEAIRAINVTLSKERIISLPSHQRYHYRVKQLLDYNATHETMDVPYNYAPDVQFAKWVSSQRYEYRLLMKHGSEIKSYLTPERVKLLDAIGFPWNVQYAYYHGEKKQKPGVTAANHTDYSSWNAQKKMSRTSLTTRWMAKWHCLSQYKKEYGHVRVPEWYEYTIVGSNGTANGTKVKLGIWVKNQRKNYRNHCNDEHHEHWDRIRKLNELGFIWDTRSNTLGSNSTVLSGLKNGSEDSQYGSIYNATWMKRYQQLKDFHESHGHFQIPSQRQWKDLSIWVKTQRVFYKHYQRSNPQSTEVEDDQFPCNYSGGFSTSLERIQLLDDIGFDWNGTKGLEALRNETWWTRFGELKMFKEHFGHLDVDIDMEESTLSDLNVIKLRHWVKLQRVDHTRYSSGEKSSLTPERIEALSRIGFIWNKHREFWREKFEQLKNFYDEYGTFDVPTTIPSSKSKISAMFSDQSSEAFWMDMIELGRWVAKQKMFFRQYRRGESLQAHICDRMEQLDAIGFLGDELDIGHITAHRCATQEQKQALWDKYFKELEVFKRNHGHCMVPHDHSNHLGEWVSLQRRRFRVIQKKIDQSKHVSEAELDQLDRLNRIAFVFNVHDYKFQRNLDKLRNVKDGSYKNDRQLCAFVRRQRELYAKNAISQERIDKLDSIGFVWRPRRLS